LFLAEGQANRHKTDLKELEGAFHYYPDMSNKVSHKFRTNPMVTQPYK